MDTTVELQTEFIRLAALLTLTGIVGTGGEAKLLVQAGHVRVNGKTDTRRGAKIRPGDVISLDGEPPIRIQVRAS